MEFVFGDEPLNGMESDAEPDPLATDSESDEDLDPLASDRESDNN